MDTQLHKVINVPVLAAQHRRHCCWYWKGMQHRKKTIAPTASERCYKVGGDRALANNNSLGLPLAQAGLAAHAHGPWRVAWPACAVCARRLPARGTCASAGAASRSAPAPAVTMHFPTFYAIRDCIFMASHSSLHSKFTKLLQRPQAYMRQRRCSGVLRILDTGQYVRSPLDACMLA